MSDISRVKRNDPPRNGSISRNQTPVRPFRESGDRCTAHTYNGALSPLPGTLRGENDPRNLQAIAEVRRLYVGNMPYKAQLQDVRDLFQEGYEV